MIDVNPTIPKTTFNVNNGNIPVKRVFVHLTGMIRHSQENERTR